jgi:shikimate kinase
MSAAATLEMPSATLPTQSPSPTAFDRIVLTGFMGSGKSTTGELLAAELGWRFLDLDREIERRQALAGTPRTVPQIFAELGESRFRHLEFAALAALLGQRKVVIALGGGAPEELGNRLLLEQTPRTVVVYLTAPLDVLLGRCRTQAADPDATARPVLADLDAATLRFARRRPHYERIATYHVDTTILTPQRTATAILQTLHS